MAVNVKHDTRREKILECAIDVFIAEGYADATFQKIADRCGITRTLLYLYFNNKRDIFMASMKSFTDKLEKEIVTLADSPKPSYQILNELTDIMLARCIEQKKLLKVIVDYLVYLHKSHADIMSKIRRRTIRMRHIISGIVIVGQKKGELKKTDVKPISDFFFSIAETMIFRHTIFDMDTMDDLINASSIFFNGIKIV